MHINIIILQWGFSGMLTTRMLKHATIINTLISVNNLLNTWSNLTYMGYRKV